MQIRNTACFHCNYCTGTNMPETVCIEFYRYRLTPVRVRYRYVSLNGPVHGKRHSVSPFRQTHLGSKVVGPNVCNLRGRFVLQQLQFDHRGQALLLLSLSPLHTMW